MKGIDYLRIIYFLLVSFSAFAQPLSTKSKKAIELYTTADNFRVRGQFDEAIKLLQQAIDKDSKFEEAYYRLALTYRNTGNLSLTNETLEKGLPLAKDITKQKNYTFFLGDNLLRMGGYDQSLIFLNQFLSLEKFDRRKQEQAAVWKLQDEYSITHKNDKLLYHIKPLGDTINAFSMQYFPTITADDRELIFTIRFGKAHDDNEDIVISKRDEQGNWTTPTSLSDQINSAFREGASTISADGRQLIFTICGPRGCDLFQSNKQGTNWSKPISLGAGVNSAGWEAQPSLSADGNELYFVSDRKGGVGGYDIWYSRKSRDGTWGKANNLGKSVNTPFDEIAPYIHVNNQNLYYASNGLPGFGSYDIYVTEKKSEQWSVPMNMGQPLNDFEDQFSFVVTSNGKVAYYSKEEGRNKSKIYTTPIPTELQVQRKGNIVKGVIRDSKTKLPLKADVELNDLKTKTRIATFQSDSITGSYLSVIPGKSEYAVYATKPGYLFSSLNFNYEADEQTEPLVVDLELQPIGTNASVVLNNIFFDLNQFVLNDKSGTELNEAIQFLKSNPALKVEISGHTDNSGAESYNLQLSQKRAQSVSEFLIKEGIEPLRIIQKGYGSKRPLKQNDSDDNKRTNRRIEFKIIL